MLSVFTFDRASSVKWPQRCAVCCGTENSLTTATARNTFYPDFQPWVVVGMVKYQNISTSFPVCHKHKRISLLFGIAQVSATLVMVGCLLAMASSEPGSATAFAFFGGIIAAVIALYMSVVRFPIRVSKKEDRAWVIKITNKDYAAEFESINREVLGAYANLIARGLR